MAAVITCPETLKKAIITDLEDKENESSLMSIVLRLDSSDEDDMEIKETEAGLEVYYNAGEVYYEKGAFDGYYHESVTGAFAALKKKYPEIAIRGLCHEEIPKWGYICGTYFYCDSNMSTLASSTRWQICAGCGDVIDYDTFYNSAGWDYQNNRLIREETFEPVCLCCPTCMLRYILKEKMPDNPVLDGLWRENIYCLNSSWTPEERKKYSEPLWECEIDIRDLLKERISDHMNDYEYTADFRRNIDDIRAMLDNCEDVELRALLLEILNRINQ